MVSNKKEMVIRLMNQCKTGKESISEYEKANKYQKKDRERFFCQFCSTKTILLFIQLCNLFYQCIIRRMLA